MFKNLIKSGWAFKSTQFLANQSKGRFVTNVVAVADENAINVARGKDIKDIQKLAEEETQILRDSHRLYFLPWINNQKTVYESQIPVDSSFNYSLAAGVLGAGFLFMLWQGDFKYKYFLGAPLLAIWALRKANLRALKTMPTFIKEISLNKSGQSVNIILSQQGKLSTLEQVNVSSIKQVYSPEGTEFSQLRHGGYGNNGFQIQVGDSIYVAPYEYIGNEFALKSIWSGEQVDTTNI
ncbi:hypothetical protein PPERSA_08972 [Pseudocohnilembus persalinus]|uniref:Uncharacterized protein n=1 Tax=Pseudocohnilembus persalinus TaxID=266149 RepID=A0A0V0R2Y3_PSEPJ|nr:hypothetical protein PPERSA_08972 [Pseudocohnilembus persalinus]|eukprot:KRX08868.1 hypothetical protein PPERSA_08972 [Pseudocohnilembus persalinus]